MLPDGWERKTVSDICILQNGNGFKPHQWDTKGLPIIRIQNLNGSSNFNYFSGKPLEKWLVNPGQILFAWAGSKGVSFGPFIWNGPQGVLNQHIFKVFSKGKVDKNWLYLILRSITDKIEGQAHGFKATLVHVKKQDIDTQVVNLPPLPEQKKIAAILSTWDRAIEGTEKLLANSQQQKKALMQQLLTGKKRLPGFTGEWKKTTIGNIAKEISIRNKNRKNYPVISCTKTKGFVDSLSFFNKKVYSDDLSGYKIISRNQIGFPSNHIEEGSIGLQNIHDDAIVSPIYTVFSMGKNADPLFVFAVLKTDHYRQIFAAATNSSVDRRGSLRWSAFSQIKINLPSPPEQKAIAAVLTTADEEITAIESDLSRLRQEKKALMQQLLTGKRRVTVD
ncbi:restriction endonuclease subunit S [Novacetimonas cocois]|uniref:Restriction endonuclease subunit S n=1 Tax=Novacetimonas cocois TaxID=1747507 RepID=A0A365YQX2_9PROT|nr:restriction endonuclease subunit S [Novacetimonas cocois]RBM04965.1 restriction endonuclease subunit S [Novacetimonas cocois]